VVPFLGQWILFGWEVPMSVMLELGAKGRVVIPAAVRREAEIELGETLIARAEGPGRIVLETPAAVQARVWAAAPVEREPQDSVRDVRSLRDDDNRIGEQAARQRRGTDVVDSQDDLGEALLRALEL
jgi:bifunctional DNA-binding transcriptional regulator/antitoxin component of YhaV-PrlF toxin-antitoxin module